MKKLGIIIIAIIICIIFSLIYFIDIFPKNINLNNVNKAILYSDLEEEKNVTLDNKDDIFLLTEIFNKSAYDDSPACGFYEEFYIKMFAESKSLTFYPAPDGCEIIYVDEYDKYIYITDEERQQLNSILEKYGLPTGW